MLNKYAKQKKRRRNFSIDRRHHYEKILEESAERASRGYAKRIGWVVVLSGLVMLGFLVNQRMANLGNKLLEVVRESQADDQSGREKTKKKRR